jgi:transcription elongation factor GreA-like protein
LQGFWAGCPSASGGEPVTSGLGILNRHFLHIQQKQLFTVFTIFYETTQCDIIQHICKKMMQF